LANIVNTWVARKRTSNSNGLILAVAETNIAVDNIMQKLLELNIKVIRSADYGKIHDNGLWQYTFEYHLSEAQKKGKVNKTKLFRELIKNVDVVCATSVKSGEKFLKKFPFTQVIVDEVSQTIGLCTIFASSHFFKNLLF
jgi:hypothetical protein